MSFNYRKEEYALQKHQAKQKKHFRESGMIDEQIAVIEEMEWDEFRYRRNQDTNGITVPLMVRGEDGFEHECDPIAMSYEDENFGDPFTCGFDDPRLQRIWEQADDTDKLMLRYLSEGYSQPQVAQLLEISQQAVSKRIGKFKK